MISTVIGFGASVLAQGAFSVQGSKDKSAARNAGKAALAM